MGLVIFANMSFENGCNHAKIKMCYCKPNRISETFENKRFSEGGWLFGDRIINDDITMYANVDVDPFYCVLCCL